MEKNIYILKNDVGLKVLFFYFHTPCMKKSCPFYDISGTALAILKEILAFKEIFGILTAFKILETKTCHHLLHREKGSVTCFVKELSYEVFCIE